MPSTATRSKIAWVFGDGIWETSPVVWWWQKKKIKKSTTKKKPGSVLGYLITLLCTALVANSNMLMSAYNVSVSSDWNLGAVKIYLLSSNHKIMCYLVVDSNTLYVNVVILGESNSCPALRSATNGHGDTMSGG